MRRLLHFILPVFLTFPAQADQGKEETSDTSRTFQLGEVVVTATRTSLFSAVSPVSITVIPRSELLTKNGTTLATSLQGISSVFVKDYGGFGDLKTLSLRGTGAEHTLVLIDGVRYNSVLNGLIDLSTLSMESIDRIELVRGGNSAMYGTNAMGGTVHLLTSTPPVAPGVEVSGSLGSFSYRRYGVQFHGALLPPLRLMVGASDERSDGDFPFFDTRTSKHLRRSNADLVIQRLFGKMVWEPDDDIQGRVFASRYVSERGVPGPLIGGTQGSERLKDEVFDLLLGFRHGRSSSLSYQLSAGMQIALQRYFDPPNIHVVDNYYKTRTLNSTIEVRYLWTEHVQLVGGVDADYAIAEGNALSFRADRSHVGAFATSELLLRSEGSFLNRFAFYPSLRYDHHQGFVSSWSPKFGFHIGTRTMSLASFRDVVIALRGSVGKNFRVPTINELYYDGSGGRGNPSLLNEKSTSFDIGLTLNCHLAGDQAFGVTYFTIDTENRILWLPTVSAYVWSPRNLGRVRSTGLEVDYRWALFEKILSLEANYTLTDALKQFRNSPTDPGLNKQLMYVPLDMGNIAATLIIPMNEKMFTQVSFHTAVHYVGIRYTTEDNTEFLPWYTVVDGNIALEVQLFGILTKLKLEINNLLNENYQVLQAYPIPLRNYQFSVTIVK